MIGILAGGSLSLDFFLGLCANEEAPDASTLTLFKSRRAENAGLRAYEQLFGEIIRIVHNRRDRRWQLRHPVELEDNATTAFVNTLEWHFASHIESANQMSKKFGFSPGSGSTAV